MRIEIVAKTDIGKEREQNEDAFIICPDLTHPNWELDKAQVDLGPFGTLLAVADGMGGANAGEVASGLAMETLRQCFSTSRIVSVVNSEQHVQNYLQLAIKSADTFIKEHIIKHPETAGMGTTIVVCWILNNKAYIVWCGDSRCYMFNPKKGLMALTKDHSYVQELIDKGELTEEESFSHPDSNIITRGLGDFDTDVLADIVTYSIQPNDVFLLCSDGLSGYCRNSLIEKTIKTNYQDINKCCDKLMDLALDAGGYDNICIALASVCNEDKTLAHSSSSIKDFFKKLFFKK